MKWLALGAIALASATLYGRYMFLISAATKQTHPAIAAPILQAVALAMGLLFLGGARLFLGPLPFTKPDLALAGWAGAAIGLAEVLAFCAYRNGLSLSVGAPIIYGGSVLAAVIFGLRAEGSTFQWYQWLGVGLAAVGVGLIAAK